jgi:hypothetical protein
MFAAAPKGTEFGVDVSLQVEGYAAARVRLPEGDPINTPMRNIEIAWENFFDGTSKQTTLPDAGMFTEGDIKRSDQRRFLDTALMSVSAGSIFIRPHTQDSRDKRLFLLDAKGKRSTPSFADWQPFLAFGQTNLHSDNALAEGKPVATAPIEQFEGDATGPFTMLLAPQTENGLSKATATSLFPPTSPDHQRLLSNDWTYRGPTEVGVVGISSEPRASRATATFLPFRPDGTFGNAVELPTPYDLPELPRPCKADERRTTPRVAAHALSGNDLMFPGYRHPVLVTEAQRDKPTVDDALVLLTWGTVLHGTKEAPCVAAWEAFGVAPMGTMAVISGDPSQAWLFRRVEALPTGPGLRLDRFTLQHGDEMLEHRPMSCRFDSSATIPETVWAQSGTFRWITK